MIKLGKARRMHVMPTARGLWVAPFQVPVPSAQDIALELIVHVVPV